mmetsp:Transcript_105706/g.303971  ORF Transcript_105706/g.303971 Transcript_105706/m.303971 type:complete len:213 (+) Transcript_105706:859-1497(+)
MPASSCGPSALKRPWTFWNKRRFAAMCARRISRSCPSTPGKKSPKRRQDMWTRMVFNLVDRPPPNRAPRDPRQLVSPRSPQASDNKRDGKFDPKLKAMLHPRKRRGSAVQSFRSSGRQAPSALADLGDQVVVVSDRSLKGHIRFVGETRFAAGEWLGVELFTAGGKNDGSVNGVRYFECAPRHGLFVRRTAVEVPNVAGHMTGISSSRRPSD